ncbi:MAG TPA: ORF6N domain-containing protein [Candidatus Omnitrophota bacterium]|nr:ORF6N domain-containing protein [Candidatus Omnitrophota bacterium]
MVVMNGETKKMTTKLIPQEIIQSKIFLLRGQKIMFDKDLAKLYGVATKVLNQAVKRNIDRFPSDFMFLLTPQEVTSLRSQFVTSTRGGLRYQPCAFTEHGILMLSSVLNSKRAIQVNIQIMRAFTKLREMLVSNKELRQKIEEMEKKYDHQFKIVFQTIKELLEPPTPKTKGPIGFHG